MLKSGKILRQEEEFVKLNAEIDTKTQTLLKEVEEIKVILFIHPHIGRNGVKG